MSELADGSAEPRAGRMLLATDPRLSGMSPVRLCCFLLSAQSCQK
jgi:hypothetical protein